MKVMGMLDLSFRSDGSPNAAVSAEMQYGRFAITGSGSVYPSNQRDFELFLNLVAFASRLLAKCSTRGLFLRWAFLLCKRLVEMSNRFPHVSGFYKLLGSVVGLCEQYRYFRPVDVRRDAHGDPILVPTTEAEVAKKLPQEPMDVDVIPGKYGVQDSGDEQSDEWSEPEEDDEDTPVAVHPRARPEPPTPAKVRKLEDAPVGAVPPAKPASKDPSASVAEVHSCYALLQEFLFLTLNRMNEYKGDLLASAITFTLSLPLKFLNVRRLVVPLRQAFTYGLSYPPLANAALDALERWLAYTPAACVVVEEVLPVLQQYLSAGATAAAAGDGTDAQDTQRTQHTVKKLSSGRSTIKTTSTAEALAAPAPAATGSGVLTEAKVLRDVQLRIVRLLGKLGGVSNVMVRNEREKALQLDRPWDRQPRIDFPLPFRDLKPNVFFDSFLPKVVELAESGGERRTKVAAGELLHSVVVFMMGRNAHNPRLRQQHSVVESHIKEDAQGDDEETGMEPTEFYNIYKNIFPTLLRLAVDTEQVTHQLFHELIFQVIHWMTQNIQYESKETMALLDAVLDGLSSPTESALRDLCAQCLEHFQRWSIKHGKKSYQNNLRSLYLRLNSLAHHPSPWHRLGAGMAYNRLYRDLREHDDLVDLYALELVGIAVVALQISDYDEANFGTTIQWEEFLGHLEHIIAVRSEMLLLPKKQRGRFSDISALVEWLFERCGCLESACREKCMQLFVSLCTLREQPQQWVLRCLKLDRGAFLTNCEKITSPLPSAAELAKLSYPRYMQWCRELEAAMHCYSWLIANGLIQPHYVFSVEQLSDPEPGTQGKRQRIEEASQQLARYQRSAVLRHAYRFLEHSALSAAYPYNVESQSIDLFCQTPQAEREERPIPLTPSEERRLRQAKTSVVERLLVLTELLCSPKFAEKAALPLSSPGLTYPILSTPLYRCLLTLVLTPAKLGYDTNSDRIETGSLALARHLLRTLLAHFQAPSSSLWRQHEAHLHAEIQRALSQEGADLTDASLVRKFYATSALSVSGATCLVRGYRLLNALDLLSQNLPGKPHPEAFAASLAATLYALPPSVDPVVIMIATELWSLCFALGLREDHVQRFIGDATPVTRREAAANPNLMGSLVDSLDTEEDVAFQLPSQRQGTQQPVTTQSTQADVDKQFLTRGQLFYRQYRSELDQHLLRNSAKFATSLVDAVVRDGGITPRALHILGIIANVTELSASPAFARRAAMAAIASNGTQAGHGDLAPRLWQAELWALFPRLAETGIAALRGTTDNQGTQTRRSTLEPEDYATLFLRIVRAALRSDDAVTAAKTAVTAQTGTEPNATLMALTRFALTLLGEGIENGTLLHLAEARLRVLIDCLDTVPLLGKRLGKPCLGKIVGRVRFIVNHELPIRHSDLQQSDPTYDRYIDIVEALLRAMGATGSVPFMAALLPLFRAKSHPLQHVMAREILNLFQSLDGEQQRHAADCCVATFRDDSLPCDVRLAAIHRVCLCVLEKMSKEDIVLFFSEHIRDLLDIVVSEPPKAAEGKDLHAEFTARICCYALLEALYRLCPLQKIREDITRAFIGPGAQGKELTEKVARCASNSRAFVPGDPERMALQGTPYLLQFHQAAFNCACAVVLATQKQEKFFSFLFRERVNDLWEHIVDCNVQYDFQVETNFVFARDAVTRLRLDWDAAATGENASSAKGVTRSSQRMRYLSSQYLQESSLSQDPQIVAAAAFYVSAGGIGARPVNDECLPVIGLRAKREDALADRTPRKPKHKGSLEEDSLLIVGEERDPTQFERARSEGDIGTQSVSQGSQDFSAAEASSLELDDLNSNPCMATILRLVDHLSRHFPITAARIMPTWMSDVQNKLRQGDALPLNVRLFLAKIVINRPQIFAPFAEQFFVPLCRLAVSDRNGGRGFHYFVRDLCLTFLSWEDLSRATSVSHEAEALASQLVERLMKFCASPRRFILSNNLAIVKLLIEKWRGRLRVNKDIILGWLCQNLPNKSQEALARTTGLQLLGAILANGYPAYDAHYDERIREEDFYNRVIEHFGYPRKEIREMAGEVVGMALSERSRGVAGEDRAQLLTRITEAALRLFLSRGEHDLFLIISNKIAQHHPPVLDSFLPVGVVGLLANVFGIFKALALQAIARRAEHTPDLYKTLATHLPGLLEHKDEQVQLLTLQILHKLLRDLVVADVRHLLHTVLAKHFSSPSSLSSVFSESCRIALFDVLVWLYDNRAADIREEIDTLRSYLLLGLADDSIDVRANLLDFWDHETRLPLDVAPRLERIFTVLFEPVLGERWLTYAAILLLKLTRRSPEYSDKKAIFKDSLAQCEFTELLIDTSWQHRSLPMTPMFAPSHATVSQTLTGTFHAATAGNSGTAADLGDYLEEEWVGGTGAALRGGKLLATQGANFPSSQVGVSQRGGFGDIGIQTQTAMLFAPFSAGPRAGSAPREVSQTYSSSQSSQGFRRRFIKQPESVQTKQHILRATRLKRERELFDLRHKLDRANRVRLLRAYRAGELPDIQVAISEFIEPLESLCLRDVTVARLVFAALFDALFPRLSISGAAGASGSLAVAGVQSAVETGALLAQTRIRISNRVQSILTQCSDIPGVAAFLHAACLKHPELAEAAKSRTVYESAMRSRNLLSGILLLEQGIVQRTATLRRLHAGKAKESIESSAGDVAHNSTRDVFELESSNQQAWMELGAMYRALGEEDAVRSVFTKKLHTAPQTKQGFEYSLSGDHQAALQAWENVIALHESNSELRPAPAEIELWHLERLRCMEQLLKWDELANAAAQSAVVLTGLQRQGSCMIGDSIEASLSAMGSVIGAEPKPENTSAETRPEVIALDSLWKQPELMYLWITGRLRSRSTEGLSEIAAVLSASSQEKKKIEWLERRFPAELAVFALRCGRIEESRVRVERGYEQFLRAWGLAPSSASRSYHRTLLHSLQRLVEVDETLDVLKLSTETDNRSSEQFRLLLKSWHGRLPSKREDEVLSWDSLISTRTALLDQLEANITGCDTALLVTTTDTESLGLLRLDAVRERSAMYLAAASVARRQDNLPVCHSYMQQCQALRQQEAGLNAQIPGSPAAAFSLPFFTGIVKMLLANVQRHRQRKYLEKLEQYQERNLSQAQAVDPIGSDILRADVCRTVGDEIAGGADIATERFPSAEVARRSALEAYERAADSIQSRLVDVSQGLFKPSGEPYPGDSASKGLIKLARLCDDLLREKTDSSSPASPSPSDAESTALAENIVTSILQALQLNRDSKARQVFPRILELVSRFPSTRHTFESLCQRIPSGILLAWVPQLLANLSSGGPLATALLPLLGRLAKHYPQNLYFPFHICLPDLRAKLSSNTSTEGVALLAGLQRLEQQLDNSTLKQFVASLELLHHPDLRYKEWAGDIRIALQHGKKEEACNLWAHCIADCFDHTRRHTGAYNRKFAEDWGPKVKKDFGDKDGKKLMEMDLRIFSGRLQTHLNEMKAQAGAKSGLTKLRNFSEWLADYQHSGDEHGNHILLPHQPQLATETVVSNESRVIMSFGSALLVMGSMERPKRIQIHCNDEKDYFYLVKGGEDLRQDQRIEQLFGVMNSLFANDPHCAKYRYKLRQYDVIPLSKHIGLLEWVPNTMPLKALIEQEMAKLALDKSGRAAPVGVLNNAAVAKYQQFIQRGGEERPNLNYIKMYRKANRDTVVSALQACWDQIRPDYLLRGLRALTSSPQAFFWMRRNFCTSLALVNISSYILGIGDRHLENFLLDTVSGELVAIDFGHAFGTATEALPVPELIPFRLTRQLTHVAEPLGIDGMIRPDMVRSVEALRRGKHVLLNTMEVFVKEPLVEWLKKARREADTQKRAGVALSEADSSPDAVRWYPARKIAIARRKLQLENPALITLEEVKQNPSAQPEISKIEEVVRGVRDINARAAVVGRFCSGAEEYVSCLIDQATDPSLLGRTYVGWAPFF
eukprot:TRINITY_DN11099_c0_g1_i3.p1 TRINITY_DN11099_c0_g1~~TRINITY_DN11099_c0_g1_i3.p1  ORF type:complete len:4370 (-),score=577.88 TRINITY_DN11099_c0_g1_i3:12-11855(-)